MQVPSFLKLEGEALVFNEDNKEFIFYIPEDFFGNNVGNNIAEISGEYISFIGICNWAIIDSNGKSSPIGTFTFPTMTLSKPYTIEKVKDLKLGDYEPGNYRLLRFKKGDEVISQIRVPQLTENIEMFVKLCIYTAKIPNSIPYDKIWELFIENAKVNDMNYGLHSQIFGLLVSTICRDPNNIERPFRLSNMNDMRKYKPISIRLVPKFISPHTAITSEGLDEGIRAAIIMKDKADSELPENPLERIMTR